MKKTVSFICIIVYLLFLIGCDPAIRFLDKNELIANTVKIELYDYKNENPKNLRINGIIKPKFNFNKATLIATLDEAYFENILNDIAKNGYMYSGSALNEPIGKTLVLHQSNGNIIVLFGCPYTNNDNKTYYYGDCYVFDKSGALVEYIGGVGQLFSERIESTYFQDN